MSSVNELDELYEIVGQDAMIWLEQARKLKYSADVMRVAFNEIRRQSATIDEVRVKQLAFMESFMMLTGFAIENLVKGIDIASNPQRVANRMLNTKGWPRGGHNLTDYAKSAKLSPEKTDLLKRLEEYTVWAGRYNIPTKADTYIDSHIPKNLQTVYPTDFVLIDELFEELSARLKSIWSVNGGLNW